MEVVAGRLARLLVVATVLGAAAGAQAPAPFPSFGLSMGVSEGEVFRLLGVKPDSTGSVTTKVVPRPDEGFEIYRLRISTALGLCRVSGIGRNIAMGDSGAELKRAFTALASRLTTRHGPASGTVDRLNRGSLFDEPNEWTMGLLREERTLLAYWEPPANAADLSRVSLRAVALNRSTGYLLLAYESRDYRLCRDEVERKTGPL